MRIVTFNILHGRLPVDDRVDIDRYAKAVRELDADVLALQEVDRFQVRSENADLTAVAAEAMGATEHRFVAALAGTPGATWISATGDEQPDSTAYGVALLSRYPVRAWEVIRLPGVPVRVPMFFKGSRKPELVRDEPRVAVAAFVDSPLGEVMVVNTHLSFIGWWNRRQLRTLTRALPEPSGPLVLVGDLNMGPDRAQAITGLTPLAEHLSFPAHQPREQLDHVLVRGDLGAAVSSAVHELPLSDHRALSVEFIRG
ncbi:MAG: endonuclease/exonuclease/phosphatase family protein [Nocardioidaceae bacterium]